MKRNVPAEAGHKSSRRSRRLTGEDIAKLVDRAIGSFRDMLDSASGKFSAGDLVRLVQLRKELSGEAPGTLTVGWVDECRDIPTN